MSLMDIFNTEAFSTREMTAAINKIPTRFTYLGGIPGLFGEVGSINSTVFIKETDERLQFLNDSDSHDQTFRKVRPFLCAHKQINDEVLADQVIGVRMFGSETEMQTAAYVVANKMEQAAASLEVTLEFMRMGAVKGQVLDADGSVVNDMFEEFKQQRYSEKWKLGKTMEDDGAIKKHCSQLIRRTMKVLGGTPVNEFHLLCGNDIFDALETSLEVRNANRWRNNSDFLVDTHAYRYFEYGGVRFVNYLGFVGDKQFIDPDKAYWLPVGVPNLFTVNYGPSDYMEYANTVGIKYYAKQERIPFDKGIQIECQTNPLVLCTRPAALCEVSLT